MSDDLQRGNPLETAPIPTLLLRYSVPTALTLMVNFLYNIVDQIFIGRGVGISGMTATNIAFPLVILVGAVSLLLGDGCAAYVSLALGRRQQAEADAAVGQTVTLLLVSGIVLAALSALLAPQLVWLLGTTETAYAQSVAYLRTIVVGIPFQLLCPALTAIVRADGSPQYTMRCMLAGARSTSRSTRCLSSRSRWASSARASRPSSARPSRRFCSCCYLPAHENCAGAA